MKLWSRLVNYWELLPTSRRPSSKSYDDVVKGVKDDLIVAKIQFFRILSKSLYSYLTKN